MAPGESGEIERNNKGAEKTKSPFCIYSPFRILPTWMMKSFRNLKFLAASQLPLKFKESHWLWNFSPAKQDFLSSDRAHLVWQNFAAKLSYIVQRFDEFVKLQRGMRKAKSLTRGKWDGNIAHEIRKRCKRYNQGRPQGSSTRNRKQLLSKNGPIFQSSIKCQRSWKIG